MSNDQSVQPNGFFEILGQSYSGYFDGERLVIDSQKSIPNIDKHHAQEIKGVWNNIPVILEDAHCIEHIETYQIYSDTRYRYTWEPGSVYWGDLSIRGKEEIFIATTGKFAASLTRGFTTEARV